jgi:probable F420-dependent oxidoreductase
MKIRIGVGTGGAGMDAAGLSKLADDIVTFGLDSIWISEILTAPGLDPLVALAWVAAHNPSIKLGTTMLLPGRNPVRLAGQIAALSHLAGPRLFCTFVPGLSEGAEKSAIGVTTKLRGQWIETYLPLLHRLWQGERVSFTDENYHFEEVAITPLPSENPLEIWLGGMAKSALVRCGRFADGWLPARCTPAQAARGKKIVEEAADEAGREISDEHYGVSLAYSLEPLSENQRQALVARNPEADPNEIIPVGYDALSELLSAFIAEGFSKFVLRPLVPPATWHREIDGLATHVGGLQT